MCQPIISTLFKRQLSTLKPFTPSILSMQVIPIKMRWGAGDNYCYAVIDKATNEGTLVDPASPPDVLPTLKKLESQGFKLTSITNTHHHYDHSDGNVVFKGLYPGIPIYAGKDSPLVTVTPPDGDKHSIGQDISFEALHTPCHTQDSICWLATDRKTNDTAVFTGDTLFTCGVGRFFEGDAQQMQKAFNHLVEKVPLDTKVYPGHEYTKSNVKFAVTVDPDNKSLRELESFCKTHPETTGCFTLQDEKNFNPFMRTDNKELQARLGTNSAVSTMAKLRQMKDRF